MPFVRLPGDVTVHIKMAKPRRKKCSALHRAGMPCSNFAGYQCDYALGKGKTCDAWLCRVHATDVGPDQHHCPAHSARQRGLFTELIS